MTTPTPAILTDTEAAVTNIDSSHPDRSPAADSSYVTPAPTPPPVPVPLPASLNFFSPQFDALQALRTPGNITQQSRVENSSTSCHALHNTVAATAAAAATAASLWGLR